MKLGEAMYAAKSDDNAGGDTKAKKDDVVDAEFTEVKDDKNDKSDKKSA